MNTAGRSVFFPIVFLGITAWAAAQNQVTASHAEFEKRVLQQAQLLAGSDSPKDRLMSLEKLDSLDDMNYELLWKLMNDTDIEVRMAAIQELRFFRSAHQPTPQIPPEQAAKIIAMLEKEVTPERIAAAFKPGHVKELPAALVLSSAGTLNHIYEIHFFKGRAIDYAIWQWQVLRPIGTALARQNRDITDGLEGFMSDFYHVISDPMTLMDVLHAIMQGLDDPSLARDQVEYRLQMLWSHPLLGKDKPLNLMLVAQFSPRLESLTSRILGPMPEDPNNRYARQLIQEITEAVMTAREKLAPPTTKK